MRSSGEDQYISACISVHVEGSDTHTDTHTDVHTHSHSLLCTPVQSCSTQTDGQVTHLTFPAPTSGCLSRQTVQEKLCRFMICFFLSLAPPSPPALVCVQGVCMLCPLTEAALDGGTLLSKPRAGAQCYLQWRVIPIINILFPSLLM